MTLVDERTRKGISSPSSKFSDDVALQIVEGIVSGLPLTAAAPLAGVTRATAKKWYDEGAINEDSPYAGYALAVEFAEASLMAETLDNWRELGLSTKQWTAFATFAERMWPEQFAKRDKGGVQVNITNQIGVVEGRLQELHQKGELVYDGG